MKAIPKNRLTAAIAALSAAAVIPTQPVIAQQSYKQIEEIIITAQRRYQILQKVPIAVSAIDEEAMAQRGIENFGTYLTTVPGAYIAEMGNQGNEVKIRGIGNGTAQVSPTTAIYLGEIPIIHTGRSLNSSYNFRLVDMWRVEVLRGPQGQLFGSNSLGGAIRNIPNEPSLYQLSAKGSIEYAEITEGSESYNGDITVDIPIIPEKFGLRATAYHATEGGWYDNVYAGAPDLQTLSNSVPPLFQPTAGGMPIPGTTPVGPPWAFLPPVAPVFGLDVATQEPDFASGPIAFVPGTLSYQPAGINYAAPSKRREDVNEEEIDGGRLIFKWAPIDDLEVDLTLAHEEKENDGNAWATEIPNVPGPYPNTVIVPTTAATAIPYLYPTDAEDYEHANSFDATAADEIDFASLVAYYDLGFAALTSSTGYWDRTESLETDLGILSAVFLTGIAHTVPASVKRIDNPESFSQEFRLTSNDEGRLTWLAGMFYQKIEQDYEEIVTDRSGLDLFYHATVARNTVSGAPLPSTTVMGYLDSSFEDEQIAVFGEVGYDLSDKLNAAVSFRYFELDQTADIDNSGFFYADQADTQRENDDEVFTPKATVSWQIEDGRLLYGTVSEGFRTGITNKDLPMSLCGNELAAFGSPDGVKPTDPDSLLNYELGTKLEFMNRRLGINAAAYHIDWQDLQSQVFLSALSDEQGASACNQVAIFNVGDATIQGMELEVSALLTDQLRLDGAFSYIDSEYEDTVEAASIYAGDRIDGTPDMTVYIGLNYDFQLMQHAAYARVDWNYVGDIEPKGTDFKNQEEPFEIGDYNTINLRAGMELNENLGVDIWANNVTNEFGVARNIDVGGQGAPTAFTIRPRTVGATLRWYY